MSLFSPKSKPSLRHIGSNKAIKSFEHLSALFGNSHAESKSNISEIHKSKLSICLESENIVLTTSSTTAPSLTAGIPTGPSLSQELGSLPFQVSEYSASCGPVSPLRDEKSPGNVPSIQLPPPKESCAELPGSFSFEAPDRVESRKTPTRASPSEKEDKSSGDAQRALMPTSSCEKPRWAVNDFAKLLRDDSSLIEGEKAGVDSKGHSINETKGDTYVSKRREVVKDMQLNFNELKVDDSGSYNDRKPPCGSSGDLQTTYDEKKGRLTLMVRETQEAARESHLTTRDTDKNEPLLPYVSQLNVRKNGAFGLQNFHDAINQEVQHISLEDSCRTNHESCYGPRYRRPTFNHPSDCSCYRNEAAALKFRVVELEYLNATLEGKLRQYREEIKLFKKDVKGYKKDEKRHQRELQEKDAEIYALNKKIAQLVGQLASTSISHATKSTARPKYIKKELPFPAPARAPSVDRRMKAGRRPRTSRVVREDESIAATRKHRT
ncbi:hypothetical protein VTN77DRAFT_1283 [Rasamsonia byssochlamydoides]|uniref:uncharacterized protein n=1 Tax=Rasamsonia byssochlamydoides TaxID=89139 RepID=UPI0037430BC7